MSLFRSIDTSASGLTAQRLRMDVISNNIANVNTTRTPEGGAYRRQMVVFMPRNYHKPRNPFQGLPPQDKLVGTGVRVIGIVEDYSHPFRLVYDPSHPDANKDGYVAYPNVNSVTEFVDMIDASRAYEANVTALNAAKSMMLKALEISK